MFLYSARFVLSERFISYFQSDLIIDLIILCCQSVVGKKYLRSNFNVVLEFFVSSLILRRNIFWQIIYSSDVRILSLLDTFQRINIMRSLSCHICKFDCEAISCVIFLWTNCICMIFFSLMPGFCWLRKYSSGSLR